jgi:hypothetical protein
MAQIQAELAQCQLGQIGSPRYGKASGEFTIGPENETGLGPWKSSFAYYHDAAEHALNGCLSDMELNTRCSFALPLLFKELVRRYCPDDTSPFSLTPRFRIPQYSCRRQIFYYRGYRFRWDHGSSKASCRPVSCPVCLRPPAPGVC